MSRINKSLYLGWIMGGALAGLLLLFTGVTAIVILGIRFDINNVIVWILVSVLLVFLGIGLLVINVIYSCMLLYKAWQAIQGGQARTTPEKAVGFIFIPFYNFYWYFIAYWAFARDYNLYLQQKAIDLPRLPEKLFLFYPILLLCGLIPVAGYAIGIATLNLPRLPENLLLSNPIPLLYELIPVAGYAIDIAALVILFIISIKIIDAVNSLHDLDITQINKLNIQE
jgi:hypothetical protein